MTYEEHIPVNVITGFLGSGKTTLLQRLPADPGMADPAVLINDFGPIGLAPHPLHTVDAQTVLRTIAGAGSGPRTSPSPCRTNVNCAATGTLAV